MSTDKILQIKSDNSEQTEQIGAKIGSKIRGGEVIELISDLGGGKTTLVRGVAKGAGSADKVASPSFTLSKLYKAGDIEIHHMDLYRLQEAGLFEHELQDLIGDLHTVVVVEWGEVVGHVLPKSRLTVRINKTPSGDGRVLGISYPDSLSYLVEDLC